MGGAAGANRGTMRLGWFIEPKEERPAQKLAWGGCLIRGTRWTLVLLSIAGMVLVLSIAGSVTVADSVTLFSSCHVKEPATLKDGWTLQCHMVTICVCIYSQKVACLRTSKSTLSL